MHSSLKLSRCNKLGSYLLQQPHKSSRNRRLEVTFSVAVNRMDTSAKDYQRSASANMPRGHQVQLAASPGRSVYFQGSCNVSQLILESAEHWLNTRWEQKHIIFRHGISSVATRRPFVYVYCSESVPGTKTLVPPGSNNFYAASSSSKFGRIVEKRSGRRLKKAQPSEMQPLGFLVWPSGPRVSSHPRQRVWRSSVRS